MPNTSIAQYVINLERLPDNSFSLESDWNGLGLDLVSYQLAEFFLKPIDFFKFLIANEPSEMCIDCASGSATIFKAENTLGDSVWLTFKENDLTQGDRIKLEFEILKEIAEEKNQWLKDRILFLKEQNAKSKQPNQERKIRENKEFVFESQLEAFLQVNEIHVERQVRAKGKILDLWVPGQLIIECKAGSVSANDACQAIDYLVDFELDVLLIGSGLTKSASRAINAVNKLSEKNKILFVTKECSFGYLKGVCK